MSPISSPSNMMRPEVWSNSRITIIEVVDLPQPDLPDEADALAMPDGKTDAVDGAEHFGLGRRLAREQFGQRRGGALTRIFLDEFFDQKKRLCGGLAAVRLARLRGAGLSR